MRVAGCLAAELCGGPHIALLETDAAVPAHVAGCLSRHASLHLASPLPRRYEHHSRQRLDLALLAFFQNFRKVYVGEQVGAG